MVVQNGKHFSSEVIENLLFESGGKNISNVLDKYKFTSQELKIISLINEKKLNKDIADELFISELAVENHRNNIYQKIGVKTTKEFIQFVIDHQIVFPKPSFHLILPKGN